ncbi:hypothetical protein [Streptomyces sp. NPDC093260]|uniref:hypothetical protein n=1 Tax=Streptomyces sp. NPDC093260 TaxID=3155073 RepID=UPI0034349D0D
MEAVVAVFALLFLLCLAFGAYATVKAVGAAKRGVDRTISQARRTVEDHTLRARSLAQPGPAGELAELRLSLRTSMRATQDALYAGAAEDESLKESLGLFERLSAHGHELDGELKRLESEPDRATLAARLPDLRARTRRITRSADSLRWAARDRARRFADDDLDALSAQIDVEAGALRHWTREEPPAEAPQERQAAGHDWRTDSGTAGPDPARPDAARSPDSAGPGPARQLDRPAITPPTRRPAYSWNKKPRPESTT